MEKKNFKEQYATLMVLLGEQRERYKQIGEIAFINEKGESAKQEILAKPSEFSNRVANRFWAAFIVYNPFRPMDEYVGGGWPIFYFKCIFPLPILGLFAILALRAAPLELELRTAIAIVCFSLAPYVLVSYYGGTSLGKNGNCRFSGWLGSANLTYV